MRKLVPLAVAATLASLPAHAACVAIAPGLPGWERLNFDDIPPNVWSEEGGAVVASSNGSASLLYASAPGGSLPVLTWKWRVDKGVPATDLTRKGGDDRSIALTVGFAYDPSSASMGERMKRVVVEAVAGADAPGRVIEFVWGGMQPVGSRAQSPYSGSAGQLVTLRAANTPTGQWMTERVDLATLYTEIWGSAPPPATRIALTADSDDTGGSSNARIADVCFSTR